MFRDKLRGIGLPPPPPHNKIEENPIFLPIYAVLEIKINTMEVLVCYLMKKV